MRRTKETKLPPSLPPRWCEEQSRSSSNSTHKNQEPRIAKSETTRRRTYYVIRSSSTFLIAQELLDTKSSLGDIKVTIARTENILNEVQKINSDLVQQARAVLEYAQNMKEVSKRKMAEKEIKMASMKEFNDIREKQKNSHGSTFIIESNKRIENANSYYGNYLNKYKVANHEPLTVTNIHHSSQSLPEVNGPSNPVLPTQPMITSSINSHAQYPRNNQLYSENSTTCYPSRAKPYQNEMHAMYGASSSNNPYQPL